MYWWQYNVLEVNHTIYDCFLKATVSNLLRLFFKILPSMQVGRYVTRNFTKFFPKNEETNLIIQVALKLHLLVLLSIQPFMIRS